MEPAQDGTGTGRDWRAAIVAHLQGLPGGDAAHDMGHIRRVEANAARIAAAQGPHDARALMAAALLHDCIAVPKSSPLRAQASQMAANHAERFLDSLGFGAASTAIAVHAIHAHSYSAGIEPTTPEACALQDADRLDALGAIGIARCFATSGAMGRALFEPMDPLAHNRPLDEQAWALDHFQTKLLRLPSTMRTPLGCKLAMERAVLLVEFMNHLAEECAGLDGMPA